MYRFGCCIPGGSFMPEGIGEIDMSTFGILKSGYETVLKNGYDYAEASVGLIMNLTENEFERAVSENLKFEVCNCFIPISLSLSETSIEKLYEFVDNSMSRMKALGTDTVIFGSGKARSIKKPNEICKIDKFISLCNELAIKYGLYVAIEPLNKSESNIFNSVEESGEYVKRINLSNVKLLADAFHMYREDESLNMLHSYESCLIHIHVSEPDRSYPGKIGGDYLMQFAESLKKTSYSGRITSECSYSDFISESYLGCNFMKEIF